MQLFVGVNGWWSTLILWVPSQGVIPYLAVMCVLQPQGILLLKVNHSLLMILAHSHLSLKTFLCICHIPFSFPWSRPLLPHDSTCPEGSASHVGKDWCFLLPTFVSNFCWRTMDTTFPMSAASDFVEWAEVIMGLSDEALTLCRSHALGDTSNCPLQYLLC